MTDTTRPGKLRAEGAFDLTEWTEVATHDKPGATISRVLIGKTFHGDLDGTSTTEIMTVTTAAGPAAYVGVEHVDGTLDGRTGTFVLQHIAGDDGEPWMRWLIVPTSGTGQLEGLRGEGRIVNQDGHHTYTLDYDLD
ncbi:hypothetical protein Pth03_02820 [Planotetraspora thailandica]|uniref:DUF3224 domain-containing protein n=1 Tax=Planotetraspora thailandica TaxID=487172 RepID=A0A8J3UV81_9ACTN|nr:DUF3224 domain-containing protein [Planotetraspora thailandica]GII51893.1 hypothetical protein Pth03_02820 [Planotetraspora thailandica]